MGSIDQLAILNEHRGKDLGKLLVWDAFDNFYKNDAIHFVTVLTTSKNIGEKFYQKKLGFSFLSKEKSARFPDETLYRWGAKIRQ